MSVVIVTPRDNGASKRSAGWADQLARLFPGAVSCHTTTSRSEVEDLLARHEHVLYFGHGELEALVVPARLLRKRRPLIDGANVAGPPTRVVVAVACWSGDGLARSSTDHSAPDRVAGYIGWRDEVSWPTEWPAPIGEAVVAGVSALLSGGTVGDCQIAMRTAFDRAHDRYREAASNGMSPDRAAFGKMCAIYWRERIAVEGDLEATLV